MNPFDRMIPRRGFLRSMAAVATTSAFPAALRLPAQAPTAVAASERVSLGVVGTGGMGQFHLAWLCDQPDVHVAAICDVDQRHLEAATPLLKDTGTQRYHDYRELLTHPDLDAVLIATPDHWHGLIALASARAGKHIYCEKPLTNSIGEGRAVCEAVAKHGVLFQTGSHERSNPGAKMARKLVREGRLGEVREVRIQMPVDDPHLQKVKSFSEPTPPTAVPDGFDYDFWLGHTPALPYVEQRCHFWWRFISAYGGGEMTDRGAHVIDLAQMILDRDQSGPVEVIAQGQRPKNPFYDTFIEFTFENRYADGLQLRGSNQGPRGLWLHGTEGKLFVSVHGGALTAEPASLLGGMELPEAVPYVGHRREFLQAIREPVALVAPAEAGHRTATICHLNNLAMRLGRPLKWDPVAERTDDAEANSLLLPKMREPWDQIWNDLRA